MALVFDQYVVLGFGVVSHCFVDVNECRHEIRSCCGACSVRGGWIPLSPVGATSPLPSDGFPAPA